MSDRNRDDYFDLDNFDETIDSREYRRRQAARNNRSSNGRRPSGGRPSGRRPSSRRKKTRTRNRIIIVIGMLAILSLLVFLLTMMFRGCGGKKAELVSTDTMTQQEESAAPTKAAKQANAQANAQSGDPLSISYFMTPSIEDDNSEGTDFGTVYGWKGAAYELFGGDESMGKNYGESITKFAEKLPGLTVYSMVVPNHTEYGLPQRLKDGSVHSNSQSANIKAAYEAMGSSVTPINAYNYIGEHNKEYVYFNSDHHWTGLGAYYAYKAFADTNKMTPLMLEDCTEKQIDGFTGTFTDLASGLESDSVHYWEFPYSVSMEIHYAGGNTETYESPYYENAEAGPNTYGVFIFGDNPLTVLKSSSENAEPNRKIAVVKESYGNAFVSYLTQNYSEVHVLDMRSFRENSDVGLTDYCQKNGITDVLFLNGIMSANNQQMLDGIEAMLD